ncbi:MAG: TetR/AcrR family transcriptional regulator C-terminal domain-containing protein [Mycolicibacterium sp.]|uniref:TetR/AcrR family transcriptional regulator C-terminal domain-containing protein n=1 Tax=Mycolicibacterium sp. TaxID=2320850 RepID=UPI003D139EB2
MQLHKRDVVEAATSLLDDYGIADLSMRRVARELAVSPGALYWHFASKQQLLGAVADRILEAITAPAAGPGHWRDRFVGICGRLREALLSHTDGAELVAASFAAGQSQTMADVLTQLSTAATDAGMTSGHAELAARTVIYYTLGFTANEQSRMQWDAAGADVAHTVWTDNPTARFDFGLGLLVDGIAAHNRADA